MAKEKLLNEYKAAVTVGMSPNRRSPGCADASGANALGRRPGRGAVRRDAAHLGLQPQSIDQSSERARLLTPARVIKEEPWEGLAPVLQHADELAACEFRRHTLV